MLDAALALVIWTLLIWILMYIRRLPAMKKANIAAQDAKHHGSLDNLPSAVRAVGENYNHLHEQPVIFYALVFYTVLRGNDMSGGASDAWLFYGAWAYVVLRVLHSIVQVTFNNVTLRFILFVLGSIVLMVMAVCNVLIAMG